MLCYPLSISAQLNISVVAGVNISQIKPSNSHTNGIDFTPRFSGHLGGTADLGISKHSLFRFGAIYCSRGSTATSSSGFPIMTPERSKVRLDFLEIPALYVRHSRGFEIFVGPQYAHLLLARLNSRGGSENIKPFMEKSVFDLRGGFGITPGNLGFQFTYIRGLSSAYDGGYYASWNNNALCVSLTYRVIEGKRSHYGNSSIPHRTFE